MSEPAKSFTSSTAAADELASLQKRPLAALAAPITGLADRAAHGEWFLAIAERWDTLPEEIKDALILMQRPFPGNQKSVYYLSPYQALMVVRYCRETQINVHSDHWWFDPRNCRMGSTVSGQREEARRKGVKMSPPVFRQVSRPWPDGTLRFVGFTGLDIGIECTIDTPMGPCAFVAWLSTSGQGWRNEKTGLRELKDGPWRDDYLNMLTIRAEGRCLERVMGGSAGPDADWASEGDDAVKGANDAAK